MEKQDRKVDIKRLFTSSFILLGVIFSLTTVLSVYSWFYVGRRSGAIAEISNPTAIYINAGHQEDIRYLDLGGIDVDVENKYKDYVFCVRGNNVQAYKLQLAYTTNNQFEFEIYEASESDSAPGSAMGLVIYETHNGSGTKYYSMPTSSSPIPGTLLNKDDSVTDEILAKTGSDRYYEETYTPEGGSSPYTNHHKHAVPLYWQATNAANPVQDSDFNFCDYYILRVKWTSGTKNDKETDIIYISAKNITY